MGDWFVNAPWWIRDDGGEGVRLECVGEKILLANEEGSLHLAVVDFFYFLLDNCNEFKIVTIAKKDQIRKYSVDLLGNKNEVRKKCGELLSLAKVKN